MSGLDIDLFTERLARRSSDHLAGELETEVISGIHRSQAVELLDLHEFTAVIGVNDPIGLLVAFSFEAALLERLFAIYTRDIDVDDAETAEFMGQTAGDVINVVVGHVIADLGIRGVAIRFSPPVVVSGARRFVRCKGAHFHTIRLDTQCGQLSINVVGPPELFDARLNCLEDGGCANQM